MAYIELSDNTQETQALRPDTEEHAVIWNTSCLALDCPEFCLSKKIKSSNNPAPKVEK